MHPNLNVLVYFGVKYYNTSTCYIKTVYVKILKTYYLKSQFRSGLTSLLLPICIMDPVKVN